jgi:hypothetical protein
MSAATGPERPAPRIIDDLSAPFPRAANGAGWELIADRVMGGVSSGDLRRETVRDRPAIRMTGQVSLENGGGFLQMALDLAAGGGTLDARGWTGIEADVTGDGERYNLHLRTADVRRPWQSWRASFETGPDWERVRLPFADFEPHRIEASLDLSRLRRIGLVAIGRAFRPDLALGGLRFYA